MALNKQPIFTSTPVLVSKTTDVQKYQGNIHNPDAQDSISPAGPTEVFTATDSYGTLIERITVSGCGSIDSSQISEKYIYLFIYYPTDTKWALYKSAYIPSTTISLPTLNPEIEWTFTGGLLLPNGYKIGIGASENVTNTGRAGDYLAITIEGSSYTQPA